MTSREILIDLIDRKIIDGEKAFTLINDLLQSELMESWKILNESSKIKETNNLVWTNPLTTTWIGNYTDSTNSTSK